jgi:hypothetical protein
MKTMVEPVLALAMAAGLAGAAASQRPIEFSDVPRELLSQLDPPVTTASQFDRLRANIRIETAQRIERGEQEALAYFILQSASFTRRPRIEPSVSARAFAESSGPIPADVRARVADFLAALQQPAADERLQWFARVHPSEQDCLAAYRQAAQFLYPKDAAFQARGRVSDPRIQHGHPPRREYRGVGGAR